MGLLSIKPGTAVTRQYRNFRKVAVLQASGTALWTAIGTEKALSGKGFATIIDGGLACYFVKRLENSLNAMYEVRPQYKAIINRAKSIYKHK